ncbi:MAG: TetR/AcrR family transcriptional regulator [Nonomuraea sp.]|nr:TetR/AcrR family transcriptional regulator [Nonomuraea sp.]
MISRAQQKRETEARILAAARETFAELGYERTTIRAVASAAGVNPGLVMHYFGSKEELFARSAVVGRHVLPDGDPVEVLTEALRDRLEEEPLASLVVLRSMLTHDDASQGFRASGQDWLAQIADALPGPDAELRAGLISALITGVVIDRYLLKMSTALAGAPAGDVLALLRPVLESLVTPPPGSAGRPGSAPAGS